MITRAIPGILAVPVALALAACDTSVTNPGPVQDGFLDSQEAQPAIVAGMGRALGEGINWIGYTGAAIAREIHPSGSTGSFGITVRWQRGELDPLDADLDTHWEQAQQARWLAEHGIERIEGEPASPELLAQAYLYAGYANRLLGENYCEAVIDGGPAQPSTAFLDRGEQYFTQAIGAATGDLQTAAYAGRASVRADLGDWDGALADASQVATSFKYQISYYDIGSEAQLNRIEWATHGQPYRGHTEWNTWYSAYANATGDPRVPYKLNPDTVFGDAAIDCCGKVPWWPQQKYASPDAPITLSSGSEMRLIEAEKMLMDGNVAGAVGKINELRSAAGVPLVTATTATDAWTALKRERGIVLWLEARRLNDLRRWSEAGTPGALDPLETPSGDAKVGSHLVQQDLCFPIAKSEQDTNPNIGG